jgi:hypothetical protein
MTIEVALETPSQSFESCVTNKRGVVYALFYATPLGPFVLLGIALPVAVATAEGGLRVGDRWSASGPGVMSSTELSERDLRRS